MCYMKYLKIYEDYFDESFFKKKLKVDKEKFEEEFRDLFVEEIDKGFTFRFSFHNYIEIYIEHELDDWFNLSDIYEDILVFVDYMKEKYPDMKFSFNGEKYEKSIKSSWGDEYTKRYDLEPYINEYFSYIELNFE